MYIQYIMDQPYPIRSLPPSAGPNRSSGHLIIRTGRIVQSFSYCLQAIKLPEKERTESVGFSQYPWWCALFDLTFLQSALELLYNTQGRIRISTLAAECFLSLRQFERRFKQCIGVSPKVFARLLRFEALLGSLIQGPAISFTDVSSRLGYHDQAHVIHEFKTWAGCTPTAFIARAKQREMGRPIVNKARCIPEPLYIV